VQGKGGAFKRWFWRRREKAESKAMEAQMEEYFGQLGENFGGILSFFVSSRRGFSAHALR